MNAELEITRLDENAPKVSPASNVAAFSFIADGADSASESIGRVREVMRRCLRLSATELDDLDRLKSELPMSFVNAFASEPSESESKEYLGKWRAASAREKADMERRRKWSLLSWLFI